MWKKVNLPSHSPWAHQITAVFQAIYTGKHLCYFCLGIALFKKIDRQRNGDGILYISAYLKASRVPIKLPGERQISCVKNRFFENLFPFAFPFMPTFSNPQYISNTQYFFPNRFKWTLPSKRIYSGENPDYISNKILIKRGREEKMKLVFMKYKRKKLPHKQMGENPWKGEEGAGIPLSYP